MDYEQNLNEVLKVLRKEKGFSQEKLAHACELDRTCILAIERGISSPAMSRISKISDVLGIPHSGILKRVKIFQARGINANG